MLKLEIGRLEDGGVLVLTASDLIKLLQREGVEIEDTDMEQEAVFNYAVVSALADGSLRSFRVICNDGMPQGIRESLPPFTNDLIAQSVGTTGNRGRHQKRLPPFTNDLIGALMGLGCGKKQARQTVAEICGANPESNFDTLLRLSIQEAAQRYVQRRHSVGRET